VQVWSVLEPQWRSENVPRSLTILYQNCSGHNISEPLSFDSRRVSEEWVAIKKKEGPDDSSESLMMWKYVVL